MCLSKLDFSLQQLAFDMPEGELAAVWMKTQLFQAVQALKPFDVHSVNFKTHAAREIFQQMITNSVI